MSFPKAKFIRFNEELSCAPAPTKYNPKFDSKVKGAVIVKGERFVESKLKPATSLESLESTHSSHKEGLAKDSFRTPQLPKKKVISTPKSSVDNYRSCQKFHGSEIKVKKKLEALFRYENEKTLVEQINELTRAHTSQLLEKNQEICSLHDEIEGLKSKISNTCSTNENICENSESEKWEQEILKLNQKYECKMNVLKSEYEDKLNGLKKDAQERELVVEEERKLNKKYIDELKSEMEVLRENSDNAMSMLTNALASMEESMAACKQMNEVFFELESEIKETRDVLEKQVVEHKVDMEALAIQHESEMERLTDMFQFAFDFMGIKVIENVKSIEKECDTVTQDLAQDLETITALPLQIEDNTDTFTSHTQILCQALQTFKIEYCQEISELVISLKACDDINQNLVIKYNTLVEEVESLKATQLEDTAREIDLKSAIEATQEELVRMKSRCRNYEIAQNETTKTVQVLSKRLLESELEIDHLNEIVEEMKLKGKTLKDKIKIVSEDNRILHESFADTQMAVINDVKEVEQQLLAKVEVYKKAASEETQKLRQMLGERQKAIDMMMSEIDYHRAKASESADSISVYQTRLFNYKEEIKQYQNKFSELEHNLNEEVDVQKKLNGIIEEMANDYEKLKQDSTVKNSELINKIEDIKKDKNILEKECTEKAKEISNLKIQINDLLKWEQNEKNIDILKQTIIQNEKYIEELSLKVEHYVGCAQKTALQTNNLVKEIEEKNEQLSLTEEAITEKDLKIESLNSELNESKTYVQTVTEHMVSLMNELSDKCRHIEVMNHEMEMKNATMIQVSEEYEKIKTLYEIELRRVVEIERDMQETQQDNEKYVDELISELVLEKERCSELSKAVEELEEEKSSLTLKESLLTNQNMKVAAQKTELLEVVGRQNEEIESLTGIVKELRQMVDNQSVIEKEKNEESKLLLQSAVQAQDDLTIVQQMLKEKNLTISELQGEEIILRDKIDALESDIATITQDKFSLEEQVNSLKLLENNVISLTEEKECLEEELGKLRSEESNFTKLRKMNNDLEQQVDQLQSQNSKLKVNYSGLENRKNEYKQYAVELEKDVKALKQEANILSEEREKLKEQCHEDSMKFTALAAELADLECRNRELESMIGPFREQLIQFEKERNSLLAKSESTEKELRTLELEHAKMLGHHNHKQKIKYLVNLTETIADQKKEIEKLRQENKKLSHLVDSLSKEKSDLRKVRTKKNQENPVLTETSPMNKRKPERLTSPATALKDRNVS